jgi:hypothetical protein
VFWAKVWLGGGALVRLTGHLGWPGGQVSWPHRVNMTRVESIISLAPNPG